MFQIPEKLAEYYKDIKPRKGYIYYFLEENLQTVSRDQLKIGVGFYRSPWIDGSFLFECDSYLLKSLKEFLAARYLKAGNFNIWAEWTYYYSRLWASVGLSRLMGTGSFYLTGHGPVMIIRKPLDEIPEEIEIQHIDGREQTPTKEGYLVYRDPGGGAHLRNWKIFYVVLSEILDQAGVYQLEDEIIQYMSGDPESRFVIQADEEVYGFPNLYKVTEVSEKEAESIKTEKVPPIEQWVETEAQFDAGGFMEEFKAYYKFMSDHYAREDKLPDPLGILEHGLSWFLSVIPDEIRSDYKARYYELTRRFASSENDKKMIFDWLDRITETV
ncbi:MAG: hypothetical protein ABIC40_07795, partial [bacterium]